jgi:chaperone modulatory protein CbpM
MQTDGSIPADGLIPPDEYIPATEFCAGHQIELSFIRTLHESGLIETTILEGTLFLPSTELRELERLTRLHYEMDINLEGVEAISHLLRRVSDMQEEILSLRNKLRFYQSADGPGQQQA